MLFMIVQLGGWAGGSILLLLNTYWTYITTLNGIALMIGLPEYMMSPRGYRATIFYTSLACVLWYFKSLGDILYNYVKAESPADSFLQIMDTYLLAVQLAAFVPSLFIVMYDGIGTSPFSLFSETYGMWNEIEIPGWKEFLDERMPDHSSDSKLL